MTQDDVLRKLMANHNNGTCGSISPDADVGCQKRVYHDGDCRNVSVNVSWCGWCLVWICDKHSGVNPDRSNNDSN